jgi:peptide subunit release factor 1 (eRF1)
VNGLAPTLNALAHGQVRSLLVDPGVVQPGHRCRDTGRLVVDPDACAGEGAAEPVPDVIDEAIEEALRQGSHVDVLEDAAAREAIEGLAATLRFRRD